jgi:hypothetical protein
MAGAEFHYFAIIRAEYCFGLNYTPMVSVDTPSRDTIPLTIHEIFALSRLATE